MTRFPGAGRLRRTIAGLRPGGRGGALVLAYHRVSDLPFDPQLLAVTKKNFEDHMAVLGHGFRVIGLVELVEAMRAGSVEDRTVAVTFDDGYVDNLHSASPVLEERGIPATVFVTSDYVGQDREYWWDELERLLLQPGCLPDELTFEIEGIGAGYEIAPYCEYSGQQHERLRAWNVLLECPTPRHRLYMLLCERLRAMPASEREDALTKLRTWAGCGREARPSHRPMNEAELQQLRRGSLVDVGAHTRSHSMLASQSSAEQRAEILGCKHDLEELLGGDVNTFSYPFGGRTAYSEGTRAIVQEAGFAGACANFPGRVRPTTDPLQLPRHLVRDWDGAEFRRRLDGWFSARA